MQIVNSKIFDSIGSRITCVEPGRNYVEINVQGIALDMDLLKSYFHFESIVISYSRNSNETLSGRIIDIHVFNEIMAAFHKAYR